MRVGREFFCVALLHLLFRAASLEGTRDQSLPLWSSHDSDRGLAATPATAKVRVFNDLDSSGIMNANTPGLQGIHLRIVDLDLDGEFDVLSEAVITDNDGWATFTDLPRGDTFQVKVITPPPGAVRSVNNRGEDDDVDSDLIDGNVSSQFKIHNEEIWAKTSLGYRMPTDVQIRVFNDENGNGIQDDSTEEGGISDVRVRLTTSNGEDLKPVGNNGTAHEELVTNEDGFVTFTKVPQSVVYRAVVTETPYGAVPTRPRQGKDRNFDSDLRRDGTSYGFKITKGAKTFRSIDLGYRLPKTVVVRVWDDMNGNGIQDEEEHGIPGVKLRLVNAINKSNLVTSGHGTAEKELATDEKGFVYFTAVPGGVRLNVKVTRAPESSSATRYHRGEDPYADSNLKFSGFTDRFEIDDMPGNDYKQISLGYRTPKGLEIRSWNDLNGDGVQDVGEPGIEGVKLRLVYATSKKWLENQEEITTDKDGFATFPNVPGGKLLRVQVTKPPPGGKRTAPNRGEEEADSDLSSDMFTTSFNMNAFKTPSPYGGIDMGFVIDANYVPAPEVEPTKAPTSTAGKTVTIRVWNDKNKNGIYDGKGENGIEGVALLLLDAETKKPIESLKQVVTDQNGDGIFKNVPTDTWYRVKVTTPPPGGTPTIKKAGTNQFNDSDLSSSGISDSFNPTSGYPTNYQKVKLGYVF